MKILFFDSETTGVPKNYNAPASDLEKWPRLVQIAWIQHNTATGGNTEHEYIIYPDGFTIPEEASSIHGVTTELAMSKGFDLKAVLQVFARRVMECDLIVGHNISFDRKIVGAELLRCEIGDVLHGKPRVCTMMKSTKFCRIPGNYGFKWPKLQELNVKLFGSEFDGAHDALADVTACKNCFFELLKRGVIKLPCISE